jgi:hypothetical protein
MELLSSRASRTDDGDSSVAIPLLDDLRVSSLLACIFATHSLPAHTSSGGPLGPRARPPNPLRRSLPPTIRTHQQTFSTIWGIGAAIRRRWNSYWWLLLHHTTAALGGRTPATRCAFATFSLNLLRLRGSWPAWTSMVPKALAEPLFRSDWHTPPPYARHQLAGILVSKSRLIDTLLPPLPSFSSRPGHAHGHQRDLTG